MAQTLETAELRGDAAWTRMGLGLDLDLRLEGKSHCIALVSCRLTKPLSFADCVGDELPWGWEAGFDPQIGVYYIDHINSKCSFAGEAAVWESTPPPHPDPEPRKRGDRSQSGSLRQPPLSHD